MSESPSPVPWKWLGLLAALFLLVCTAYNLATPYRAAGVLVYQRNPETGAQQTALDIGAPDERQHANYIAHVQSGKGFPVLVPGAPDLYESFQSHQPPLYYFIGAGWSTLTGSDPTQTNAGPRVRFLNGLIGIGGLIGTFFFVFWGTGRQDLGLAAAAFYAFLPMNLALHAAVTNDPLLFTLCILTLAVAMRGLQQGWTLKLAMLTGALAGLALLTKTNALALIPTLAVVAFLSFRRPGAMKPALTAGALLLLPFLVVAPWWMRNTQLYGDPFGLRVFDEAFTGNPQASLFIEGMGASGYWLGMVMWWTFRSFIGAFGYMDIFLFERMGGEQSGALYLALGLPLFGLMLLGLLRLPSYAQEADDQAQPDPRPWALVGGVFLLVTLVLFLRFNAQYFQGQARYLFPALGVLAAWFALGAVRLAGAHARHAWIAVTVVMLVYAWLGYGAITQGFPVRLGIGAT